MYNYKYKTFSVQVFFSHPLPSLALWTSFSAGHSSFLPIKSPRFQLPVSLYITNSPSHFNMIIPTSLVLLAYAAGVNAHGKLASINGANGATANGLAIVPSTPDTGSTKAIEADTTIFGAATARNPSAATGCGKTKGGGTVDCASAAAQSLATSGGTVPTANSDGTVDLTFHQVNQDGAGPLTAMVSTDMGTTWQEATVQQNVKGIAGLSLAANEDVPVKVQVPAGTQCGGTVGSTSGVCLVALANPIAGFGGSAPFQMGSTAKRSVTDAEAELLDAEGLDPSDYQIKAIKLRRSHPKDFINAP